MNDFLWFQSMLSVSFSAFSAFSLVPLIPKSSLPEWLEKTNGNRLTQAYLQNVC